MSYAPGRLRDISYHYWSLYPRLEFLAVCEGVIGIAGLLDMTPWEFIAKSCKTCGMSESYEALEMRCSIASLLQLACKCV